MARIRLTRAQADSVRRAMQDDRRVWEAARQRLLECRRELDAALAGPAPDSLAVLELTLEERLVARKERAMAIRVEQRLAGLLRPEQALRLRALASPALGDLLGRICTGCS